MILAIGRTPVTDTLGLDKAGVALTDDGKGHVAVDDASRTSADGVYALGDVIGKVDLTPTAIAAGRLLSDRLFAGTPEEETKMDYDMVPTRPPHTVHCPHTVHTFPRRTAHLCAPCVFRQVPTVVFSHPPLAVMGLTEAQAVERYEYKALV